MLTRIFKKYSSVVFACYPLSSDEKNKNLMYINFLNNFSISTELDLTKRVRNCDDQSHKNYNIVTYMPSKQARGEELPTKPHL